MRLCAGALAVGVFVSTSAFACSCPGTNPVVEAARGEARVFSARSVAYVESEYLGAYALLEVKRVWSGTVFKHALLAVEASSCGHPRVWDIGSEYVFVTDPWQLIGSSTNDCLGNEELGKAARSLGLLGPGRAPDAAALKVIHPPA